MGYNPLITPLEGVGNLPKQFSKSPDPPRSPGPPPPGQGKLLTGRIGGLTNLLRGVTNPLKGVIRGFLGFFNLTYNPPYPR